MKDLGRLVWWKVGDPQVHGGDLTGLLQRLGIDVPAPKPSRGVDVFRRLTSAKRKMTYDMGEGRTGELTLHLVNSRTPEILRRDIVHRVLDDKGVALDIWKVGDATFVKPKAGSRQTGRMQVRVQTPTDLDTARAAVNYFADELRNDYAAGLNHLDPQAIRRLVRAYLASVGAVFLEGPYFVPEATHADTLTALLHELGGGCKAWVATVVDEPRIRQHIHEAEASPTQETTDD
jgi:hypothetical protein